MGILDLERVTTFLNIFEIDYSQLIQYEILEKLVTYILTYLTRHCSMVLHRICFDYSFLNKVPSCM